MLQNQFFKFTTFLKAQLKACFLVECFKQVSEDDSIFHFFNEE